MAQVLLNGILRELATLTWEEREEAYKQSQTRHAEKAKSKKEARLAKMTENKAKKAKEIRGTCQICFKSYKLPRGISKHGFTRPGYGYLLGECQGSHHLPFEVSCDQTIIFCARLEAHLPIVVEAERAIRAKERPSLSYEHKNLSYSTGRETVTFYTVLKGDEAKPVANGSSWDRIPSYAELASREANGLLREIKATQSYIAFLHGKINEWKPASSPSSTNSSAPTPSTSSLASK